MNSLNDGGIEAWFVKVNVMTRPGKASARVYGCCVGAQTVVIM